MSDIEVLVRYGADVNACGHLGNTPLHAAALMGQALAAGLLLELGANVDAQNEFMQTPMDVAVLGNKAEVVEVFNRYDLERPT